MRCGEEPAPADAGAVVRKVAPLKGEVCLAGKVDVLRRAGIDVLDGARRWNLGADTYARRADNLASQAVVVHGLYKAAIRSEVREPAARALQHAAVDWLHAEICVAGALVVK